MSDPRYDTLGIGTERIISRIYTPNEVLAILKNKRALHRKAKNIGMVDGEWITTSSKVYGNFIRDSRIKCFQCGIKGTRFYMERDWNEEHLYHFLTGDDSPDANKYAQNEPYHFALYGIEANGKETQLINATPYKLICRRCFIPHETIRINSQEIIKSKPIATSKPTIIRSQCYNVETILPILNPNLHSDHTYLLDGDKVSVGSPRLATFKCYGVKCVECGIVGSKFYKEHNQQNAGKYYLSLYAVNVNGKEVLMTADHVRPIYRGGKTIITNLQPMCIECN